ncbi:DUF4097 family beta strand repeat-containing protein [Hymenobacter sp. BT491]|uniref:DUF4097 family beta strand repeat-containing protein n=1 Tax=Hymenobacter sp. BT491 TaxID=2766779 RepID=UPI001653EE18|nr:DUF4097 family beta strand repeat-containing protein [Hymenobacter sp. BT491]MBC6990598.1 DUF4097 family beta strand repeat protein [Hymenobacter sp. BT491]
MKKSLILAALAFLAASTSLQAQEYKTKLSGKDRKIVIDMQGGDVTVEGYNGDEVVISSKGDNAYEEPNKRADGLRPVYNTAIDNTKLGLAVTKTENTLHIAKASRADADYVIRVPRQSNLVFKQNGWNGGDLTVQNLDGSLEIAMTGDNAKLLNVSGPVVANSVSGDITVRYSSMQSQPSSISVVSGDLDVTMPANAKANLSLRSVSGEIYTDFDLAPNKGDLHRIGGQTITGNINGGGSAVSLKTVSGDIFVRKAK